MSEFWRGRPSLVTGATGLVGSHLARELLARGAKVIALIRDWDPQSELIRSGTIDRLHVVSGSLEDHSALARAIDEHEIETVIHLGAQAIVGTAYRNPLATFEANIRGTYNLLEACRARPGLVKRVVIASSDKAYGTSEVLPYTEEMPPLGRFPYDVSKSCADLIAQAYHATYGLPVVIMRCGNIYGAGDLNWSRIVPGTIRSLHAGERPVIRSDGTFRRDYLFVEDAAAAYIAAAEHADKPGVRGEAFNFGPGASHSVLEVVTALRRLMGRLELEPVILNQAAGEIRDQHLASAKAKTLLGWKPRYSLDAGLGATIPWYIDYLGVKRSAAVA